MTEYFEVHERDGAARLGELRLADPTTTPAIADELIVDAGSLWSADRPVPEGDEDRLTVLPHRGFPGGTDDEVATSFAVEYPAVDYPSAAVVSPTTVADHDVDAYVLSNAQAIVGHAAAFREAIITVRETIPADTALYLSGVATPRNVATLVAAGVDLVDTDRAVIRGSQGRYLTTEGDYRLEELTELPCSCSACLGAGSIDVFDRDDCIEHNVNALRAALRTVRERIRRGRLRDYLEGQARHEQWCTATFREFDQQWRYLEQRTPVARRADITAASEDTLRRVEIQRFADRVTDRYVDRFDAPLVLVPCSARKPYSDSQSHGQFHDAIKWRGHIVSMTSPIGVVPQELELTYPAQHYDSVVTGRWSAEEIDFVARVLERYLDRTDYARLIAHVPDEGYRSVVERATTDFDGEIAYTVADHPTDEESLANLRAALDGEPRYRKREREHNTVRAIADYQFGEAAGDQLFEDIQTEARYPKHRVLRTDGTQLATLVPTYGLLALTLAGGRQWVASDAPTKRVEIEAFVPHGSVLAPGVTDASAAIRVGDEVVVDGPAAFGVGRATMTGPEMIGSTRGVAVDVRHVEDQSA
ncbi:MAG: archaeosine synthase subunit alpha [Halobacteriales archaeon]|nr:archaeosine synthase subunit alpha [Halobacteriales archaeon]